MVHSEYVDDPGEPCPEPKPPEHSQNNTRLYKEEVGLGNKSWSSDTDSEISMEEDEREEAIHEGYKPFQQEKKSSVYGFTTYNRVPIHSTPTVPRKQILKRSDNRYNSLVFSGKSKDPEM
ncbi:unnamed protein product [Eruca vesicaria subsp. sativa]|uniref:Uncharacterized protein n=1 Tax=Eruca vesicaria subsp. sativa TaxID=29727 RepID=A0ABC8IWU4_ERUVS|nr:unnamed protein product [Eruca vesicaria subsp. sativa]